MDPLGMAPVTTTMSPGKIVLCGYEVQKNVRLYHTTEKEI